MAQVRGDCELTNCPLQARPATRWLSEHLRIRLADAYAEQSRSDFQIFKALPNLEGVEECHRLHYLQMACEKIAKAYRLRSDQAFTMRDLYSHKTFSRFIDNFLKSQGSRDRYQNRDARRRQMERYARSLAREIERLAPSVDREESPMNVEYPWIEGEQVSVPARFAYSVSQRLTEPGRREFMKLIEIAIEDYSRISLNE